MAEDNNNQAIDLATLGKSWTPPQGADASPEVADVLTELPSWAARGLLYVVVGFVATALIWAYFSRVDVTVEARGSLVPEGYVRPVQSIGAGQVQAVRAREGDKVERGDIIVQLDGAELRGKLNKLREQLMTSREQLRQLQASKGPVAETLDRQNSIDRLESDIAATQLSLDQTSVRAPITGLITKMDVRSTGVVVAAGQQIGAIAPAGARLVVEAQVSNRDIAFIEPGLPAKLKLDAFPYQDYGIVEGKVLTVSPDAQIDEKIGSYYKVTIESSTDSVSAQGKTFPLKPGLSLTAEVVTERKSILNLILEPFRKLKSDASGSAH
ncbi:MAG TPA: HlyD family efflux transporter periplasmic adaptor subunit [Blastocatellia bacterium]|nr:HlyD family efflux transporter periplasmic adaptor subunit [Blastocatellia bacterium]